MEEKEVAFIAKDMWKRETERRKHLENKHDVELEKNLFDELNGLNLEYFKKNPEFKFYWHMQIAPECFKKNEFIIVDILKKYIGKFNNDGLNQHYIWCLAVKEMDKATEYLLSLYWSLMPFSSKKYEIVQEQRDYEFKIGCILQCIYRIQDKRYVDEYLKIIRDEKNIQYEISWIVLLLGKLKVKEAIPYLIEMLDMVCYDSPLDNDLAISIDSITSLGYFKDPQYIKYVQKFLNAEGLPGVKNQSKVKHYREVAIKSINKMGKRVEKNSEGRYIVVDKLSPLN